MPPILIPANPNPRMTGAAEGPKQVKAGEILTYAITQKDQDTFISSGALIQQPDPTCWIVGWKITSMPQGGRFSTRSIGPDGTFIWDVVGRASTLPGAYVDWWKLINRRLALDLALDPPVDVFQQVIINAASGPHGPAFAAEVHEFVASSETMELAGRDLAVNRIFVEEAQKSDSLADELMRRCEWLSASATSAATVEELGVDFRRRLAEYIESLPPSFQMSLGEGVKLDLDRIAEFVVTAPVNPAAGPVIRGITSTGQMVTF